MGLRAPADRADQLLLTLVGLVVLSGLGALAWASGAALHTIAQAEPMPPWAVVGALGLLVAVASRVLVKVRIRATQHGIMWTDAAMLIGLAVLPVPWVVLAAATGIAVIKALRGITPIKLGFAVTKESTVAFAGGMVLLAFGATGSLDNPAPIGPLILAFLVMLVLDTLLTVPVVAASSRTSIIERLRVNGDIRLVTAAVRLAVALCAVLAMQLQPASLYALPVLVGMAHLWHERWVRTREERRAWNRLTEVTSAFNGVEMDTVLASAVVGGAALFSADQVEVEVSAGSARRLVRGDARGVVFDGSPEYAPADGAKAHTLPLPGQDGERQVGLLRLRFRDQVRISEREQAMLASFALSLDIAVRNAAAYGNLGEVTAAHAHAAAHDPLTGLVNRREFERHLADALGSDQPAKRWVAVLLLDLRHFKEVNDTLGHALGDQVLTQVAQRLAAAAGATDVVARFGGDEFTVALGNAYDEANVTERAEAIMSAFTEQVTVDGLPLVVEANAGLALAVEPRTELPTVDTEAAGDGDRGDGDFPGGGTPEEWADELVRRADVAMYRAKRAGQRLATYSKVADPADRLRLMLAGRLPQAVSQREFELHFQPVVDLATGKVVGAEALARWRHPTRGQLAPGLFLDLLERSNQLAEFTAAVLDDALAARKLWRAAGHELTVSVNVSPRSLLDETFPRTVQDALRTHRTPPEQLHLELTESLPLSQLDLADAVLTRLHDIGVQLALDDFGTGHSSLTALSRVPVHQLKIDRSFIQELADPHLDTDALSDATAVSQALAVVKSIVQLGRSLDLTVVAEGLENPRQRRLLWELGCPLGQGHMFARPQPTEDLLALLGRGVDKRPGHLAETLHTDGTVVPLPGPRRSPRHGRRSAPGRSG